MTFVPPDIFGVGIADIIHDVMGEMLHDQTLIKVTTQRDPTNSSKVLKVSNEHACKGFITDSKAFARRGTNIDTNDMFILILGKSLPEGVVPEHGDKIIAEGNTYTIVDGGVIRDPAGATYTCQAK